MSQVWAIFGSETTMAIVYTASLAGHPRENGHWEDCQGKTVHPLVREPELSWGEVVDRETGRIRYVGGAILEELILALKVRTQVKIEEIAPAWRQLNDLRIPSAAGTQRFAQIDLVRAWSNTKEEQMRAATSSSELKQAYA